MKTQSGFTLLELMIVIALVSIIFVIAIPGIQDMHKNNKITAKTNEFVAAINYARTESLLRPSRRLQIEPIDNDWNKGWQLKRLNDITDPDDDKVVNTLENEGNLIITPIDNTSTIRYRARGRASQIYIFYICKKGYKEGRVITISPSGRVSTEKCLVSEGVCHADCS